MSTAEKLFSTGRTPSLSPSQVREMLEFYFSDAKPSVEEIAERFPQTAKTGKHAGVPRRMSLATVRKYLKAAGLVLPRGRANAAHLPREAQSVNKLMNRIPTELLIGKGRAELLVRLLDRGASIASMVKQFDVSKGRVAKLRDRAGPQVDAVEPAAEPAPVAAEPVVKAASEAAEELSSTEENILDDLDDALAEAPEASEETSEV